MKLLKQFLRIGWCCLLLPAFAFAQGMTTAYLTGTAINSKGEALQGANVIAVHKPSGTTYGAATRTNGEFNIAHVRVGGPYTVSVAFIGYQKQTLENIYITLGEVRRIEFRLNEEAIEIGEVQVVAERNPAFSETRMGALTHVSTIEIENLPTIGRSIQDFARLSPQIVGTNIGASQNIGGVNVARKNARYNNIQVDGAILNDLFGLAESGTPAGLLNAQPISLDAIQEFQVAIAPYDVRQGGFTGGLINAISRSGTNQFDGSVYFYGRNQNLVGKSPDVLQTKLQNFDEYIRGFRLSAPIIKDKFFLFANGELKSRHDPREVGFRGSNAANVFDIASDSLVKIINIARERYDYDPGDLGDYTADTGDKKLFMRLDWNLSNQHRLTLRHSYVDASLDAGVTRNSQIYTLTGQEYIMKSIQNSTVMQFNSTFGNSLVNEMRISYMRVRDHWDFEGTPFPSVIIGVGPRQQVKLGTSLSAPANVVNQDIFEVTDNVSYFANHHLITFGTHNEFFAFENLYIRAFYGSYEFSSIADFERGRSASYYYSYSLTSNPKQAAKWNAYQLGFYAQDEWRMHSNLNITIGIRMDIPIFPDKPFRNAKVEGAFPGYRTDEIPSGKFLWSPRIGFNWDVSKRRSTQLRGGLGIFSGRTPGVWISNQYSNTGVDFGRVDVRGANTPEFQPDPFNQPRPGIDPKLSPVPTSEINLTDKNFQFPQTLRTDLAIDHQLPGGIIGTLEIIYSKNLHDVLYQNLNLAAPQQSASDERPIFKSKVSQDFTNVVLLKNTEKGYEYLFTMYLQKRLNEGPLKHLSGGLGYTFSKARDVNSGPSTRAVSNWQNIQTPGDPNHPSVARSNFEIRHRIVGNISYRFNKLKNLATNISLFFEGRSGRPFSYVYNGDANGDGCRFNDLIYVPRTKDEIILTTNNWEELDAFINEDKSLHDSRGEIAERNAGQEPWVNQLDFRITQEITTTADQRLELTLDLLNMLNLLNHEWGHQQYVTSFYQLLGFQGYDVITGKSIISFAKPRSKFNKDDLLSRWAIQLGIRYSF